MVTDIDPVEREQVFADTAARLEAQGILTPPKEVLHGS
jgi:hypothetical protein